tara:strand:+ start:4412 stop:5266 length:855 start_codon:yes stop_codon:yes gene_type:complete
LSDINIIVTGSNSFIGNKIISKYNKRYNFIPYNKKNGYDLKSKLIVTHSKIDYIIHTAFIKNISTKKNDSDYKANILGVKNCLNLCKKYNAKFIFLSTYVYGKTDKLPISENQKTNPHNSYSKCKLACEKLCKIYSNKYNIDVAVLRIFNVYGKIQNKNFLISNILQLVKKNYGSKNIIKIYDYGTKRDYLHIDDLVKLFGKIINKGFIKYKIYNVGSGKSYSLKEILKKINLIYPGIKFNIINFEQESLVKDTKCNINKLKKTFLWKPTISLYRGLKLSSFIK